MALRKRIHNAHTLVWVLFVSLGGPAATATSAEFSSEPQGILNASQSFWNALDRAHVPTLRNLRHPRFQFQRTADRVLSGEQLEKLALRMAGSEIHRELQFAKEEVLFAKDTALYRGVVTVQGTTNQPIQYAATMVWAREGGEWKLLFVQRASAGDDAEREFWNERLRAEQGFNLKPNGWLMAAVADRKPGKALDIGMGQGRNAIALAQLGWDVTGVDNAEVGVLKAMEAARNHNVQIAAVLRDAEKFDFKRDHWDAIAIIYSGGREYVKQVVESLKPGGILVIEAFHQDALKSGPIGAGVVFASDELPRLFKDLRVIKYEEPVDTADWGMQKVRLVRLVAQKP